MHRIITVVFISVAALYFTFVIVSGQTTLNANTIEPPQRILTTNNSQGILNNDVFFVFGPDSCTRYGDPYSPANSIFTDEHPYTYEYRIVIPPDYPDDVLRIELFDPDSINQNITETAVSYTNLAINNGFPATPETQPCPVPRALNQKNTCIIDTEEYSLTLTTPGIAFEQINPNWYLRIDENRGSETPGTCSEPVTYTPAYNTRTLFTLHYNRQNNDGSVSQVDLARYTGQIGDGVIDNGEHQTDLQWVTPGATPGLGQPAFVPVDADTPINPATNEPYPFQLDLAQDLPNIVVDPVTNERIVTLNVTSLTGASKNNFAIWAGPDDDIDTIPSEVNTRNLTILNNPGAHHSYGVEILAEKARPLHVLFDKGMNVPLMQLEPEYAGMTTTIKLFDPDTGSLPPLNFYLDTLAYTPDDSPDGFDESLTNWAISFGAAGDPNGGCFTDPDTYIYQCQDQWVTYTITMPSDMACGSAGEDCTPFYGGRLMARFNGGSISGLYDAAVWLVDEPEHVTNWDNSPGCSAFPIGITHDIRAVLEPGQSGANAWPANFDYPNPAPNYYQYINHVPNSPLQSAKPGHLYIIPDNLSVQEPAFLAWNVCRESSSDLIDSLTWPGNTKDYTPEPGICTATGEPVVPGFIEFGDNSDKSMHIDDWVALSTGSLASSSLRDVLEEHIDLDRTLRLLIWDELTGTGSNAGIRIKRFGLFRLVGYGLDQGGGSAFIMVEFVGWDDSCGQLAVALTSVTIQPQPEIVGNEVTLTAVSTPTDATQPISYTWHTAAETIIHSNNLTDTASFTFPYSSTQTITVTATNSVGQPVTDTIDITIKPARLFLPMIISSSDGQVASAPQNLDYWTNYIAYWNPLAHMNTRRS